MKEWVESHLMTNDKLVSVRLTERWFYSNGFQDQYKTLLETHQNITIACKTVLGLVGVCGNDGCSNSVFYPRQYCCLKCSNASDQRAEKIKTSSKKNNSKEKRLNTMMTNHGIASNFHRTDVQNKVKESVLEKYGVNSISSLQETKDKKKETLQNWTDEFRRDVYKKKNYEWTKKHYTEELVEAEEQEFKSISGVNDPVFSSVKSLSTVYRLVKKYRPELIDAKNPISSSHREILDILDEECIEYIVNDRTKIAPKELDIYIPSLNLAFEINGTYWHKEEFVGKQYHQYKSLLAKEQGIKLVHLYEFDGVKNHNIVKNLIRKNFNKIHARKCTVKQLETKDVKNFIEENHRSGYTRSTLKYGLFYDDELVQVMTLSKPRFNKYIQYEIIRMCSKSGHTVVGGASKLFKHFIKTVNPDSVISYSSLDNGFNTVYEKLGFLKEGVSKPSYSWCSSNDRKSRYQTQMKDENKVMSENGYHKVFDSGTEVFLWHK